MSASDLRFYAAVLLGKLPYIALITAAFTLVGGMLALSLPSIYRASARILVESSGISSELARSSVSANAIEQVQIAEQQLLTRDSLLEIARRLNVYGNRGDKQDSSDLSADDIVNDMRERTEVEPVPFATSARAAGALAFNISFEAGDPDLAARVANDFATSIIDANARVRTERAAAALEFFQQDVDRLAVELAQTEKAVARFKSDHAEALPESLDLRRLQHNNYEERLRQLERDQSSLRSRRDAIEVILRDTNRPITEHATTPEEQLLSDLRRALSDQQAMFAESSPNIRALRARILAVEEQVREQRRIGGGNKTSVAVLPSEMQVQLADIEGQLQFLFEERAEVSKRLTELTNSITATSGNAAALSALERRYANAQSQYNAAVERLAEASTGKRMEKSSIGEKLTLVEAAVAPESAIKPNRPMILVASLFVGIGVGLALVLGAEILTPGIRRPTELAGLFEGQPLVTIPYITTASERFRQRLVIACAVLAVAATPPTLLYLKRFFVPLRSTWSEVVQDAAGEADRVVHWANRAEASTHPAGS